MPRDIVDLRTIHDRVLPLGAVICAAGGRFPGTSPEEMLGEIVRHSRFTVEEFRALAIDQPLDVTALPSDAVGYIYMHGDTAVQPDPSDLARYARNAGAPQGLWPSSPEITRAMLGRCGGNSTQGHSPLKDETSKTAWTQ